MYNKCTQAFTLLFVHCFHKPSASALVFTLRFPGFLSRLFMCTPLPIIKTHTCLIFVLSIPEPARPAVFVRSPSSTYRFSCFPTCFSYLSCPFLCSVNLSWLPGPPVGLVGISKVNQLSHDSRRFTTGVV